MGHSYNPWHSHNGVPCSEVEYSRQDRQRLLSALRATLEHVSFADLQVLANMVQCDGTVMWSRALSAARRKTNSEGAKWPPQPRT